MKGQTKQKERGEWEGGVGKEVQANVGSRFILETRVVIWWAQKPKKRQQFAKFTMKQKQKFTSNKTKKRKKEKKTETEIEIETERKKKNKKKKKKGGCHYKFVS